MITNYKRIKMILAVILVANLAVAAAKIILGLIIKSSSMTADGFHSVSDGASNVVALVGIYFASKPQDKDHPYGHHKIETIAALAIGVLLSVVGSQIVLTSIEKFSQPVVPSVTTLSVVVMVATLIINILVATYEEKEGKRLGSGILISDAKHTKSDIFITIGVLVALLAIRLGLHPIIDPIVSLAVAFFIFKAAFEIFKENINVLIDAAPIDNAIIRDKVLQMEGVQDVHDVRSRGLDYKMDIDMHVLVDPLMSVQEAHRLQHHIEEELRKDINENADVLIHIEPFTLEQSSKATLIK